MIIKNKNKIKKVNEDLRKLQLMKANLLHWNKAPKNKWTNILGSINRIPNFGKLAVENIGSRMLVLF